MIRKLVLHMIFLMVLLLPINYSYGADWSTFDVSSQALVLTAFTVDWAQSRDIKNHSDIRETNVILGSHPSNTKLNIYFPVGMALHTLVANYLPDIAKSLGASDKVAKMSRTVWQYTWFALESNTIHSNYKLGLRLDF